MKVQYQVITLRNKFDTPAVCCAVEFENVVSRMLDAKIICISEPERVSCGKLRVAIIVCVSMSHFFKFINSYIKIRNTYDHCILYVFDGWDANNFIIRKQIKYYEMFRGRRVSLESLFDTICVPFKKASDSLENYFSKSILHIPIGVDTSLCDGLNKNRKIDVLAYGRQQDSLIDEISMRFHRPKSRLLMYHTNHMQICKIRDFTAHRRMFWSIAQNSKVALNYDGYYLDSTHFKYSFVGQRWAESMAAGCVVLGKRPRSPEMNILFPWENSTLNVDSDPKLAFEKLNFILNEPGLIKSIGERNAVETRRRHDWAHRVYDILTHLKLPKPQILVDKSHGLKAIALP